MKQLLCKNCGEAISRSYAICPRCGWVLPRGQTEPPGCSNKEFSVKIENDFVKRWR